MNRENMMADIQKDWDENPHWENIKRTCGVADVARLSGSLHQAYADARLGLEKLWNLLKEGSKTNGVVRLSLITIILTLVVAIGGCSTASQYQYNEREEYNDEEGVEQDQEEESKQDQKAAEQGDAAAQKKDIAVYKNTKYISPDGGFVICTKSGIEKLYKKRLSQIEKGEVIYTGVPRVLELVSNEEGCYFEDRTVVFIRMAEEYALPIRKRPVTHEEGEEPCPWNALERCKRVIAPAATYVEAEFLYDNGKWYGGVFIEMGWNFELLDRPEDTQAGEDRTPNNTLSQ